MHVFIFDLQGTLTTQDRPQDLLLGLRRTDTRIALWTGADLKSLPPEIVGAVDALWAKPGNLATLLGESDWAPSFITVVDDELAIQRTARRMLVRAYPQVPFEILGPDDLPTLGQRYPLLE
jgi:hypothetical protein